MTSDPRIALIHATPVAMAPIHKAMTECWPDAQYFDLLDTALSQDARSGSAAPQDFDARFLNLSRHAIETGAEAILFTCSAFGASLSNAARTFAPFPMLKPNEAMFEEAANLGCNIAMIATFPPAVGEMEAEFKAMAPPGAELTTVIAEGAMDALNAGDGDAHDDLVCKTVLQLSDHDAIMLAHFSTARAAMRAALETDIPILTSPASAVSKLRVLCQHSAAAN